MSVLRLVATRKLGPCVGNEFSMDPKLKEIVK
jgi:hypothetical protein